jgi:AraC family transcriptional regulator of arabinose operon
MGKDYFRLDTIGYNFVHRHGVNIDRPKGTNNYLFLYLKSNVSILTKDGMIETTEPSFILYERGARQKYFDLAGPFINDWMHFDKENAKEYFAALDIPVNKIMVIQNAKEISAMLQDLRVEYKQQGTHHEEILDLKMKAMFCKFSDIYHEEIKFSDKLNRYRRDFNEIRNRIYTFSYDTKVNGVDEIAATVNLSTSYFQHIYKQLFGVSVMSDIIRSRIEYACHLLASNSDSITEIAFRCGYENKEHFSRQFKEITGYTPRQYRDTR